MGGFIERCGIHWLAELDAAAAEQDDSGLLIGRGWIFGEQIGRGLEPGEIAGVVRARAEFRDCGLAELRWVAPVVERGQVEFFL